MSNTEDSNQLPSQLSLELFFTRVAADETLPRVIREVIEQNKDSDVQALLAAIKLAVGETDEA